MLQLTHRRAAWDVIAARAKAALAPTLWRYVCTCPGPEKEPLRSDAHWIQFPVVEGFVVMAEQFLEERHGRLELPLDHWNALQQIVDEGIDEWVDLPQNCRDAVAAAKDAWREIWVAAQNEA